METELHPRARLEAEYLKRRRKNAGYSLRAFANLLDLPSGRLSQLLSEKRRFTRKLGEKIAMRLHYDPRQTEELLGAIARARGEPARETRTAPPYRALDMNNFRLISDPLHFSLLSLLETEDYDGKIGSGARRLNVSTVALRAAAHRLRRAGLVQIAEDRLRLAQGPGLTTSHDVSSAALRRAHRSVLQETIASLDAIDVTERDVTSVTLAIDPDRLPEAKRRIREFRRELGAFLESGHRTEVYRLNLQLMPITKKRIPS